MVGSSLKSDSQPTELHDSGECRSQRNQWIVIIPKERVKLHPLLFGNWLGIFF